jgi:4a-hydroxytetrahydrobiopterin dehydratase
MTTELSSQSCTACRGDQDPLKGQELEQYAQQIDQAWDVIDEHHLQREFKFDDFKGALDFVNKVGQLAEQEGHHPNVCFTYGQATVELFTHKIGGLSPNDFILAAKIDRL